MAKKLGLVQGLLAETRAKRQAMSAIPAPSFKAKAKPSGGGFGTAAKKAWASRRVSGKR